MYDATSNSDERKTWSTSRSGWRVLKSVNVVSGPAVVAATVRTPESGAGAEVIEMCVVGREHQSRRLVGELCLGQDARVPAVPADATALPGHDLAFGVRAAR